MATIQNLFGHKASKTADVLGRATGEVFFNAAKDCFEQRFEQGVIVSKSHTPKSARDLVASFGRLYEFAWSADNAWLGKPLKDPCKKKNRQGFDVFVQHFEEGVIWCRCDGGEGVNCLSWHDLNVIS